MRGGHFGVLIGKLKFTDIVVLRNTNYKGQRTELKILRLRSVERNQGPFINSVFPSWCFYLGPSNSGTEHPVHICNNSAATGK